MEAEREKRELAECTFAPTLKGSASSASRTSSRHMNSTKSFLSRIRERSGAEKRSRVAAKSSPKVSKSSNSPKHKAPQNEAETDSATILGSADAPLLEKKIASAMAKINLAVDKASAK